MNKSELIERMSTDTGLSKAEAGKALDSVIRNIQGILGHGDSLTIPGFGTFSVKDRSARTGRNPQTGETMEIPASKLPHFKPGKNFKEAVN